MEYFIKKNESDQIFDLGYFIYNKKEEIEKKENYFEGNLNEFNDKKIINVHNLLRKNNKKIKNNSNEIFNLTKETNQIIKNMLKN